MPTELDYLIKDRNCAIELIAELEELLASAKEDLQIAENGIKQELENLK
jgi:DNA gyrase/topoisomerase IV subunit A